MMVLNLLLTFQFAMSLGWADGIHSNLERQSVVNRWIAAKLTSLPQSQKEVTKQVAGQLSPKDQRHLQRFFKGLMAQKERVKIDSIHDVLLLEKVQSRRVMRLSLRPIAGQKNTVLLNERILIVYDPLNIWDSIGKQLRDSAKPKGAKTAEGESRLKNRIWSWIGMNRAFAQSAETRSAALDPKRLISEQFGDELSALVAVRESLLLRYPDSMGDLLEDAGMSSSWPFWRSAQPITCSGEGEQRAVSGEFTLAGKPVAFTFSKSQLTMRAKAPLTQVYHTQLVRRESQVICGPREAVHGSWTTSGKHTSGEEYTNCWTYYPGMTIGACENCKSPFGVLGELAPVPNDRTLWNQKNNLASRERELEQSLKSLAENFRKQNDGANPPVRLTDGQWQEATAVDTPALISASEAYKKAYLNLRTQISDVVGKRIDVNREISDKYSSVERELGDRTLLAASLLRCCDEPECSRQIKRGYGVETVQEPEGTN